MYDGTNMVLITPNSGRVLLWEQTASNVATLDFTGLDTSYDEYELRFYGVYGATADTNLLMRLSSSSSFISTNVYSYANWGITDSGISGISNSSGTGSLQITGSLNNAATAGASGVITLMGIAGSNYRSARWITRFSSTVTPQSYHGGGIFSNGTAVDGIRFLCASGNITAGTFRLYGIVTG